MLSGAVLGHVFASPSVKSIYSTIRVAAGSKGILLVVKNYTGDRLNFGMALEKLKSEGVEGKMLIVDDDCALPPGKGITGGRGIAGTVLVHKIVGALASKGTSLDDIYRFATDILPHLRTMGVALSMCHLPGQSAAVTANRLAGDRAIEIGMGIHGEQGRERADLPPTEAATYIAEVMVEAVLSRLNLLPVSAVDAAGAMRPVVLLINNLGSLPEMEMAIVTKDVTERLLHYRCLPVRIYSGSFMTSLDMNGVSVSVLDLSVLSEQTVSTVLASLDLPTSAPGWKASFSTESISHFNLSNRVIAENASSASATAESAVAVGSSSSLSASSSALVLNVIRAICTSIAASESLLSEYDAICGDGDCGLVMKKGAEEVEAVTQRLRESADSLHATELLDTIADAVSRAMGGTSGALLEICFRAMSSHIASFLRANSAAVVDEHLWSAALLSGVEAIKYYGGGDVGMRTMLDALVPAATTLVSSGGNVALAAQKAQEGMDSTRTMQSLAGRANYVAQERMQGIPDPGAYAVAVAFDAVKTVLL